MARKKLTKKEIHIQTFHTKARNRAKQKGVPFNISLEYLRSIATDSCPIFNTPFEWGASGLGCGKFKPNGPQLDRIIPELGYIVGNVAFISHRANRIKDNGTMQEHYDIADWIWDRTVAKTKKESTSSISKRDLVALDIDHEYGSLPRARPWEDSDGVNNSARVKISRDLGDRPIKSRSERMGAGVPTMGALEAPKSGEDTGVAYGKIVSYEELCRHIFGEPRKRGVVSGELDTE
jgi:hypothetical protein